jgi:D-glycerate 3-kinase
VLLEGWCVGARPQDQAALIQPVNSLERDEDRDGHWRCYANACLAGDYSAVFERLDLRLMFRAPSFDCIHAWRAEQEASLGRHAPGARPPMDSLDLARFIAHYERITRWLLQDKPASLIADLNERRVPVHWRYKI